MAALPVPPSSSLESRKRLRSPSSSSVCSIPKRQASEDPSDSPGTATPPSAANTTLTIPLESQLSLDSPTPHSTSELLMQTPPKQPRVTNQPLPPEPADTLISPEDRWSHIVGLRNASQVPGTVWWLVSARWLRRLEIACTGKAGKDEELVTQETLGPVDNSDIVDADGELRRDLEGDEYEPLPQEAWDALRRWYGQSKTALPRTVYTQPAGGTMIHYHPHLFRLFLLTTSPPKVAGALPAPAPLVRLYEPQPLAQLYAAAAAQLPVMSPPDAAPASTSTFRLWRLDETESADLVKSSHYPLQRVLTKGARLLPLLTETSATTSNPPLTIQGSLLSSGDCLLIELPDEAGKYPITNPQTVPGNLSVVPSPAPSNTALPPTAPPPPLFGSGASNAGQKDFFSRYESEAAKGTSAPLFSVKGLTKPGNVSSTSTALIEMKGKEKEEKKGKRGTMGLANLGNTCFMNSALQCLAHTEELAEYFLTGVFREEMNRTNPLGMGGQIAEAFGALLNRLWAPAVAATSSYSSGSSYSPREFKSILAKFAPQFSGYMQHDSQELLAFLLDGLHEDLNRVLQKPYVEKPDWPGQGGPKELIDFANTCWDGYLKRNDSVIVDLFQGQYKSTLVCPVCYKVSITFDPYMYLTLPLPINRKWRGKIHFIPWALDKPRQRITLELSKDADFKRLKQHIGSLTGADPTKLLVAEPYQHVFWKLWEDSAPIGDVNTGSDDVAVYELPCSLSQLRAGTTDRSSPIRLADSSWLLVPIFLSTPRNRDAHDSRYGGRRFGGGEKFPVFGQPFMMALTRQEASSEEVIYERLVQRFSQVTSRKAELYDNDVLPVFPAPAKESNGQVQQREDGSREASEEPEDSTSSAPAAGPNGIKLPNGDAVEHQRSWTARKGLFKMHILQHHRDQGEGHLVTGWSIETANRVVDLETRKEEVTGTVRVLPGGFKEELEEDADAAAEGSSEDPYKPLIRQGEAIMCEWDNDAAHFFFDDAYNTWDEFEDIIDPGISASDEAEKIAGKKGISLYDCLSEFTREEQLGEDDLWYCPQCKEHRQATKKFEIWTVPDILVVHLKRFSSGRLLRDKLDMMVDFPLEGLDLEGRVEEKLEWKRMREQEGTAGEKHGDPEEEPIVYDLFGVDEHLGGLGGGHYRAYAKNYADGQWYHFDDSHVSLADPASAINRNAYLLFYRRRTSRHLGGKTWEKIEEARKTGPPPAVEDAEQPAKPTNPFRTSNANIRTDYNLPLPLPTLVPPESGLLSPASSDSSDSGNGPAYSPPSPPAFDLSGNDPLLESSNLDLEDNDGYAGQLVVRGAAPSPYGGSTSAEMGDSGIITPADSDMNDGDAPASSSDAWDDEPAESERYSRATDDDELDKGYLPTPPDVEMDIGEAGKSKGTGVREHE